jgi:hypothetical protein
MIVLKAGRQPDMLLDNSPAICNVQEPELEPVIHLSVPPTKSLEEDMHLTAWSSDEFEDADVLLSTLPSLLAKAIAQIPCYKPGTEEGKKTMSETNSQLLMEKDQPEMGI